MFVTIDRYVLVKMELGLKNWKASVWLELAQNGCQRYALVNLIEFCTSSDLLDWLSDC
jgi:hypothetical protein